MNALRLALIAAMALSACARKGENIRHDVFRFGDIGRSEIRIKTAEEALQMLVRMIG